MQRVRVLSRKLSAEILAPSTLPAVLAVALNLLASLATVWLGHQNKQFSDLLAQNNDARASVNMAIQMTFLYLAFVSQIAASLTYLVKYRSISEAVFYTSLGSILIGFVFVLIISGSGISGAELAMYEKSEPCLFKVCLPPSESPITWWRVAFFALAISNGAVARFSGKTPN